MESYPAEAGRRVHVLAGQHRLEGLLSVPESAQGVVLFAHGSGSGRHSPRNQFVARCLQQAGFATLLIDLLEEDEARNRDKVFDIDLLAGRLRAASAWLRLAPETAQLPLGLFGASTGAGAALTAAAHESDRIAAVVSRGGRPDLAWEHLSRVQCPTLLIVGSWDSEVLRLNELALEQLQCSAEIAVVAGATHLFEEPGKLEEVAKLAQDWFHRHLRKDLSAAGK